MRPLININIYHSKLYKGLSKYAVALCLIIIIFLPTDTPDLMFHLGKIAENVIHKY